MGSDDETPEVLGRGLLAVVSIRETAHPDRLKNGHRQRLRKWVNGCTSYKGCGGRGGAEPLAFTLNYDSVANDGSLMANYNIGTVERVPVIYSSSLVHGVPSNSFTQGLLRR